MYSQPNSVASGNNWITYGASSRTDNNGSKITFGAGTYDGQYVYGGDLTLSTTAGYNSTGKIILNSANGITLNGTTTFAGALKTLAGNNFSLTSGSDLILNGGKETGTTGGLAKITISKALVYGAQGGGIILEPGSSSTGYPASINLKISDPNYIWLGKVKVDANGVLSGITNLTASGSIQASSIAGTSTDGNIGVNGRITINTDGDPAKDGWSAHPFMIQKWDANAKGQIFWMGINRAAQCAYLGTQLSDGGLSTLALNPMGGYVTIGTSTNRANCALTVNGKIAAEEFEIVTDVNVPDYVFDNSYQLRSLNEVEKFIAINKHLPDVPSAQHVKENGYKLADMNNTLLRKIEELTLYTIELNKQLEAIKAEMAKVRGGK